MTANNDTDSNVTIISRPPVSDRDIILFPVCPTEDRHLEAMGLTRPGYKFPSPP